MANTPHPPFARTVGCDSSSGARFAAKVARVDRVIDAAGSTLVVRLELPNPDLKVPVGSMCTADFGGAGVAAAGP